MDAFDKDGFDVNEDRLKLSLIIDTCLLKKVRKGFPFRRFSIVLSEKTTASRMDNWEIKIGYKRDIGESWTGGIIILLSRFLNFVFFDHVRSFYSASVVILCTLMMGRHTFSKGAVDDIIVIVVYSACTERR